MKRLTNPKSKIENRKSNLSQALWHGWLTIWWWLLTWLVRRGGRRRGRSFGMFRMRVPARVSQETAERIERVLAEQEALGDWQALSELGNRTRALDSSFHI